MYNTIFVIMKYLFNVSLNNTFLYFFANFPAIIPPNKGDKKSIIKVGMYAPFVAYNTITVQIINNSVNTINVAPYLNKKELCVVSMVLNSFSHFLLFYNILLHL